MFYLVDIEVQIRGKHRTVWTLKIKRYMSWQAQQFVDLEV